jgi:hypothetical protein
MTCNRLAVQRVDIAGFFPVRMGLRQAVSACEMPMPCKSAAGANHGLPQACFSLTVARPDSKRRGDKFV